MVWEIGSWILAPAQSSSAVRQRNPDWAITLVVGPRLNLVDRGKGMDEEVRGTQQARFWRKK